jgi:aromatic-amino-acid transaminase
MTILSTVEMGISDPIFGINEAFGADARVNKVNLGVGVYCNENGQIPVLRTVQKAGRAFLETSAPHNYLPIDGLPAYNHAVQELLFGADATAVKEDRIVTVQALGGTGALKIGADFLKRLTSAVPVAISDPSWENHRSLFETAGFRTVLYPYYAEATNDLDFTKMLDGLNALPTGTIVILHACCHNPTGVDPTLQQWKEIMGVVRERGLFPFFDLAYQGFADGIDADASAVRLFTDAGISLFISSSFSKSFSLYGERVGALSIVCSNGREADRVLSQLKRIIRTNYSNPPTYGATIVATVLGNAALRTEWEGELTEMRERIHAMRRKLVAKLEARGVKRDFSFLLRQRGMYSYSGLTSTQVNLLREEFGVYLVGTGRVCFAALNDLNIDWVADAIAHVAVS